MYKITLLFESNVKGIYTKEEETVTDEHQTMRKLMRMINRWSEILIPHIVSFDFMTISGKISLPLLIACELNDYYQSHISPRDEVKLYLIKNHLELLNNNDEGKRTFQIQIEKINCSYCRSILC